MTAKHTPGPWHIEEGDVFSDGGNVANVFGADGSSPQAEANARLIAAAPDLLEALELARDELQLVSDENGGSHGKPLDVIISTIAKATG